MKESEVIGTTTRYEGNKKSVFKNNVENTYQFGCEFEFYIDKSKYEYMSAIEQIKQELYDITNADILVDLTSLPNCSDKNYCMQIKPDSSLDNHGIEISVPITSGDGIKHYIKEISHIINKYGYTNEDTAMHIHISTIDKNGINFNFYKFMLLCDDKKLLSKWGSRNNYCLNVMDILSINSKQDAKSKKNNKGKVWNLEKIDSSHIEIRSIGGENYHVDADGLIEEFNKYVELFHETLLPDTDRHKELYQKHDEQVKKSDIKKQALFMTALQESGILAKTENDEEINDATPKKSIKRNR